MWNDIIARLAMIFSVIATVNIDSSLESPSTYIAIVAIGILYVCHGTKESK